jgi:hypothetical protein
VIKSLRAMLILPLAVATLASASLVSTSAPAAAANLPFYSAGAVGSNGSVTYGTGFTVSHTGTGTYVVTYPASIGFQSLPVVTVTPWGVQHFPVAATISSLGGNNGGFQFTVQLNTINGKSKLQDNSFLFTLIAS